MFIITRHARQRYLERFYDTYRIPIEKALYYAKPVSEEMRVRLEIQAIYKTCDPRRSQKTHYFVYDRVVFVCRQGNIHEYIVATCWPLEDDIPFTSPPKTYAFPAYVSSIDEYINNIEDKSFQVDYVLHLLKGVPRTDPYKGLALNALKDPICRNSKTDFLSSWAKLKEAQKNANCI